MNGVKGVEVKMIVGRADWRTPETCLTVIVLALVKF